MVVCGQCKSASIISSNDHKVFRSVVVDVVFVFVAK